MSGLVFVDTNVLLYAFDPADKSKQARACEWLTACWQGHCGRISSQVQHEFYANARKRFSSVIAAGDARAEVRRLQQWKPWLVDQPTVETAWALESRYQLSYWDALMVAAAQHLGCAWLLTEDLQHDQRIDKLRVISPFRVGPEVLEAAP